MSGDTLSLRTLLPSALTCANIVCGFLAILAASQERFDSAVYLLLAAIFLDLFDGRVARMLDATSRFGQELDSLSDALSFCAAPAFLAYASLLTPLGVVGIAVSLVFLLTGVLRLARFNVTSDAHVKAAQTLGCPTPIAAGYLMVMALLRDEISPAVAATIVVVMAILMISRIPLPEVGSGPLVTAALLVGMLTFLAVVWRPGWPTVIVWNAWNVVILLVARFEVRRTPVRGSEPAGARRGQVG